MLNTVWKSILAHKLRLISTTIAIVLGVAFIAGTYVLTDTMGAAFDRVFSSTMGGIDIAVRRATDFESSRGPADRTRPAIPLEVLDRVLAIDGVRAASGDVQGTATLIDGDGEPVGGFGPPTIGINAPADEALANETLREGRYPTERGEIALDAGTAGEQELSVGDTVTVVIDGPAQEFELVGIFGFGEVDSLAGATLTMFAPELAYELYGQDGFADILIATEDDSTAAVAATIRDVEAELGPDYEVLTGAQLTESVTSDINTALGFFTTALLVFAGVALFVGSFLIANTFTIIVAQRTRELALLRAVGASRRQVLWSVMLEALAVGVVGSTVGLLLGLVVATGLQSVLKAFGLDLPSGDTVFAVRTIVVSYLVGVGVTGIAAFAPALRSTYVAPVAAMQAVAAPPAPRAGAFKYVMGGLLFAAGLGAIAFGLFQDAGISFIGAGAVMTLLGTALLASLVVRPIMAFLGTPIAAGRGIPGQLAKENAMRSPRRTAATASALMIGLALVSFVVILGASVTRSAAVGIDKSFLAEFQVNPLSQNGPPGSSPFSSEAAVALDELDEVAVASALSFGEFRFDDEDNRFLGGVETERVGEVIAVDFVEGSFSAIGEGLALSEDEAEGRGLAVGDIVHATFAVTGSIDLRVNAIFEAAGAIDSDYLIDDDVFAANFSDDQTASIFVKLADGVTTDEARPALEEALAPYPTVQLQDLDEIKESIAMQINQLLGLMSALLMLSIVIALFGIVNTLGLSVLERTRELGLLRAVGATRPQVRTMIRWEAVLIAFLGAGLGIVIGSLFARMVVASLADEGITEFVIPYGRVFIGVVLAAFAGVVAAILPARRAARVDILRALEAQ